MDFPFKIPIAAYKGVLKRTMRNSTQSLVIKHPFHTTILSLKRWISVLSYPMIDFFIYDAEHKDFKQCSLCLNCFIVWNQIPFLFDQINIFFNSCELWLLIMILNCTKWMFWSPVNATFWNVSYKTFFVALFQFLYHFWYNAWLIVRENCS